MSETGAIRNLPMTFEARVKDSALSLHLDIWFILEFVDTE